MKTTVGQLRALIVEETKGWGKNPSRSTDKGKFIVSTGKNKARAEAIAAEMLPALQKQFDDKEVAREKGDSSHYYMQSTWSNPSNTRLSFYVDQDPYKGDWSVYLSHEAHPIFNRDDWQVIYNMGQQLKRQTSKQR